MARVFSLVCLSGQVLQLGQPLRKHGLLVLSSVGVHEGLQLVELVLDEDGLFIPFHPAEGSLLMDDNAA